MEIVYLLICEIVKAMCVVLRPCRLLMRHLPQSPRGLSLRDGLCGAHHRRARPVPVEKALQTLPTKLATVGGRNLAYELLGEGGGRLVGGGGGGG